MGLISTLLLSSFAFAEETIVCKGQGAYPITVKITDSKVIVSGAQLTRPRIFTNLDIANGLITSHGLAVTFKNHYGCIREARVITEYKEPFDAGYMDTFELGTCSGGSTPDQICRPSF